MQVFRRTADDNDVFSGSAESLTTFFKELLQIDWLNLMLALTGIAEEMGCQLGAALNPLLYLHEFFKMRVRGVCVR